MTNYYLKAFVCKLVLFIVATEVQSGGEGRGEGVGDGRCIVG